MSSSTPSVPRAPSYDDGDPPPMTREQQHGYRFNGRILLSAVVILTILTVVFFLVRLLLFHVLLRGRGGGGRLAAGVRRSFGRLSSRRHGLDAAALAALPVTAYSKEGAAGGSTASTSGGGGANDTDCAVCLSELADGEKVRALPGCGHVFHVECVDEWLRTRTTCPVCRAEVVAPPKDPEAAIVGTSTTLVVTVVEGGGAAQTRGSRTSLSLGSSAQPAGAAG